MKEIPEDFVPQPLQPHEPALVRATCGFCGRSWDDGISTSRTPTSGGRCPFEDFHEHADAKALLAEREKLEGELEDIERLLTKNENELKGLALDVYNKAHPDEPVEEHSAVITFAWECGDDDEEDEPTPDEDKSPIGYCVYNEDEDPCLDFCIFCGSPNERK